MIISIASGKGGTGKTTVATNMAMAIHKDVRILDCDVEAPNAHLFLRPVIDQAEVFYVPVPEIDKQKCTYCKKCADICRYNAIAVFNQIAMVFPELCHNCGGCKEVCPENAVREIGREVGIVEKGKSNAIEFVHGRLRVGEAMSPPLIRKVRSFIREDRINIIDAPPGTSCPVITAMKGVDFVLLVTEPTPFGLHDLKLAVAAVKKLGLPSGLVINRSDIGDNRVGSYAKSEKLPILMEIPFDRKIAEAYSNGKMIVDEMPEWKEKFLKLFRNIEKIVGQRRQV